MKRLAALACVALAGCGSSGGPVNQVAPHAPGAVATAGDDGLVECRVGPAGHFARTCAIDRADGPAGRILTLRKPDGGFRRLLVTRDGRGVVAADGAEAARVTIIGDHGIEVAIGGDAFRLPATVAAAAGR